MRYLNSTISSRTIFEMETTIDEYLSNVYFNPKSPASFTSKSKLWHYIKTQKDKPKTLTLSKLNKWLQNQDTASVFKQPIYKFKQEKIVVSWLRNPIVISNAQLAIKINIRPITNTTCNGII